MSTVSAAGTYEALTNRVSFLANKVGSLLIQDAESQLARLQLNVRTYFILTVVADHNPPSQIELARMLNLDPTLVVAHIDGLQQSGLLTRIRSTRDRRRYELRLTPAGEDILRSTNEIVARIEKEFFAPLEPEQLEQFSHALQLLIKDRWPPRSS